METIKIIFLVFRILTIILCIVETIAFMIYMRSKNKEVQVLQNIIQQSFVPLEQKNDQE